MSTESEKIKTILNVLSRFPISSLTDTKLLVGAEEKDDCAVIQIDKKRVLVIGSDFIRGTGFRLFSKGFLNYQDVGYYLVGANASDIAAMGARPLGIVTVIRYTKDMNDEDFQAINKGIVIACKDNNIPLLGGDIGGYEVNVLSAAAIGICKRGKVLLRSGGQPGDNLYITGTIGLAGAAMAAFAQSDIYKNLTQKETKLLLESWKKVKPAIKQGIALSEKGICHCAIDTSDGLKDGCMQIAKASNVNIELNADQLPIPQVVEKVAKELKVDPITFAVGDSVDFRLLFTVPEKYKSKLINTFNENKWELYEIGKLVSLNVDRIPSVFLYKDHKLIELPGISWDQSEKSALERLKGK